MAASEPAARTTPPSGGAARARASTRIQRVLTSCDGNISAAARLLGLHRRSLQRKLAKQRAKRRARAHTEALRRRGRLGTVAP